MQRYWWVLHWDKTITVTVAVQHWHLARPQLQANTAWNESLHSSVRKRVRHKLFENSISNLLYVVHTDLFSSFCQSLPISKSVLPIFMSFYWLISNFVGYFLRVLFTSFPCLTIFHDSNLFCQCLFSSPTKEQRSRKTRTKSMSRTTLPLNCHSKTGKNFVKRKGGRSATICHLILDIIGPKAVATTKNFPDKWSLFLFKTSFVQLFP